MKLLQRYPWLIDPDDEREWVMVEATPIIERLEEIHQPVGTLPAVPPWPNTWIEFTSPHGGRPRIAISLTSREYDGEVDGLVRGDGTVAELRPRWMTNGMFRYSYAGQAPVYWDRFVLLHEADGTAQIPELSDPGERPELRTTIAHLTMSLLGFLNCKNVTVTEEPPAVAKKRRKKGVPEIVYKQLVVDGSPITRGPGRETPEEADFRYHICRGHFADHREHGLFGKEHLKGVYWVPMHVRGSKAHGEIIKDYCVRPAEKAV